MMKRKSYIKLISSFVTKLFSNELNYVNGVYEVEYHPPFKNILKYRIVTVEDYEDRYVLIGKSKHMFSSKLYWDEIAIGKSKEELKIWMDLNAIGK